MHTEPTRMSFTCILKWKGGGSTHLPFPFNSCVNRACISNSFGWFRGPSVVFHTHQCHPGNHLYMILTTPSLSIGVSTGHACETHSVGYATVARLYPVALLHYFNGSDRPQLTSTPCGGSRFGDTFRGLCYVKWIKVWSWW